MIHRALPAAFAALASVAVTLPADGAPPSPPAVGSCKEHVESGATRPKLAEQFPDKGLSGYALALEVTVQHEKGETVLPSGFSLQNESDEARALARSGFYLPDPGGGAGPSIDPDEGGEKTSLRISFVPLPPKPGRQELTLPPVPIALARADGSILTVCT